MAGDAVYCEIGKGGRVHILDKDHNIINYVLARNPKTAEIKGDTLVVTLGTFENQVATWSKDSEGKFTVYNGCDWNF